MPLTINVGLSRKASENYQSRGVSLNMTAELDQGLLTRPAELQEQIAQLYLQAERALQRQMAAGPHAPVASPAAATAAAAPAEGGRLTYVADHGDVSEAPGRHGRSNHGRSPAPATAAQRRAIDSLSARLGLDVTTECHRVAKCAPEALTIRTASHMIDYLRARGRKEAEA